MAKFEGENMRVTFGESNATIYPESKIISFYTTEDRWAENMLVKCIDMKLIAYVAVKLGVKKTRSIKFKLIT